MYFNTYLNHHQKLSPIIYIIPHIAKHSSEEKILILMILTFAAYPFFCC